MKYEVIVVGGGPAGAMSSTLLARKGLEVSLIDKATFPREKSCGGAVSVRFLKEFRDYGAAKYLKLESLSYGLELYSADMRKTRYSSNDPLTLMVRRITFDHDLLAMARDAGAKVLEKRQVQDVKESRNGVELILDDGSKMEAKIVIGADGVNSIVAKKVGLNPGWKPDLLGFCVYTEPHVGEDFVEERFGRERVPSLYMGFEGLYGYGWVFPKKDHLNIGLGGLLSRTHHLKQKYHHLLSLLTEEGIIPEDRPLPNPRYALVPFKKPLERTYSSRTLLCGDAAGFVNPLTGEGIGYGIISGKLASDVASSALQANDITLRKLSEYQTMWKIRFGRELKMALVLRSLFYRRKVMETCIDLANFDENYKELLVKVAIGKIPTNKGIWLLLSKTPSTLLRSTLKMPCQK